MEGTRDPPHPRQSYAPNYLCRLHRSRGSEPSEAGTAVLDLTEFLFGRVLKVEPLVERPSWRGSVGGLHTVLPALAAVCNTVARPCWAARWGGIRFGFRL